jgi:hypothetical protein
MWEPIVFDGIALDGVCADCDGNGVVPNPSWLDWHSTHRELPPEGHPLHDEPEDLTCGDCGGRGTQLTEAGLAIMRLVARYRR